MNYEYKASGGISINTQADCEIDYAVTMYENFIVIPLLYIPKKRVTHTKRYSVLLDGSIATGGFNDEILDYYFFRDKAA